MQLLLDTHILLWAAREPARLSPKAVKLLSNVRNRLLFSAASIWEVAIKTSLGRNDFQLEPRLLRQGLLENDYNELTISGDHAVAVDSLPAIHKDPFDRMLVAQALIENLTLVTADPWVAKYPGSILLF